MPVGEPVDKLLSPPGACRDPLAGGMADEGSSPLLDGGVLLKPASSLASTLIRCTRSEAARGVAAQSAPTSP